jgi:hypothetical protein
MSKLPLLGVPTSRLPLPPLSGKGLSVGLDSLNLALAFSALLLIPNKPSPSPPPGPGEVGTEPGTDDFPPDFANDGVRSFHAATMFRTEVKGDRGEVLGRRREDGGVSVTVALVKVWVSVSVNVLGLK